MNPEDYIDELLECASKSPCERDKRGALVLRHGETLGGGWNAPATGTCSPELCRKMIQCPTDIPNEKGYLRANIERSCSGVVEHAEAMAMRMAEEECAERWTHSTSRQRYSGPLLLDSELIHLNTVVPTVGGRYTAREATPSRRRGCAPCAVQAMTRGIASVWLLHDDGWKRYTMLEYYDLAVA